MSEPTLHEVSKDLTRPGEQMNTHQAKYEGALERFRADTERFRADMEKSRTDTERFRADTEKSRTDMERFRTDMEKFRTDTEKFRADMAQRESNRMQWLIGLWVGGVLVTIAALGMFIRLAV